MEEFDRLEKSEDTDGVRLFKPEVVFDGECDHHLEPIGRDEEGVMNYKCRYCPMGKRLRDEFIVEDGKIL